MKNKLLKYLYEHRFGGIIGIVIFLMILKFTKPSEKLIPFLFGPLSLFTKSILTTCNPTLQPDTVACILGSTLLVIFGVLLFWFLIGTVLEVIFAKLMK
jgi:hypothetical protein